MHEQELMDCGSANRCNLKAACGVAVTVTEVRSDSLINLSTCLLASIGGRVAGQSH